MGEGGLCAARSRRERAARERWQALREHLVSDRSSAHRYPFPAATLTPWRRARRTPSTSPNLWTSRCASSWRGAGKASAAGDGGSRAGGAPIRVLAMRHPSPGGAGGLQPGTQPPLRVVAPAVVGILKGYDQLLNLVLDEATEFLRGAGGGRRAPRAGVHRAGRRRGGGSRSVVCGSGNGKLQQQAEHGNPLC